jgi:hypothetical protein
MSDESLNDLLSCGSEGLAIEFIFVFLMILKDSSSLNYPDYYCNNCNNKKNVYEISGTEAEKSDCPCDNQNYCYDIKEISHGMMII